MSRRLLVLAAAALGALVFSSTAGAAQLGVTAPPSGASTGGCSGVLAGQYTDDSSTPYSVPAGGGAITQWQTYTAGDTAGSNLTLVVLQPTSSTTYSVVGASTEILPNPLPVDNIASFTLSTPIQVAAGDTLALYSTSIGACYFDGGSTPAGDELFSSLGTGVPTSGQAIQINGGISDASITLNVAATLNQNQDASVQSSTFPSTTDVAGATLLSSVVNNGGPVAGPITFVDLVPSGLRIESASAGQGTCSVVAQTVTCTITGLPVGQSTSVDVVVMPSATGSYANDVSVSVATGLSDPNSANNTASATVTVSALPKRCIVPGLRKIPSGAARTLLTELGCRVGFVHQHSSIKKGLVIGVRGGVGTYPYKQLVTVLVSSGKKKKK